ncbi:hypothetical protein C7H84_21415 [Burkholderia sp. Nafp2/4-1b]|nr:hypothetical protein C7H84_21415 [Burkholderia sp. Nafp2/4-1b]
MHVAWKQCSENPPLACRAFVANCNSTRPRAPCGNAARSRASPCGSRHSVRPVQSRRAGRSVLPAAVCAARTLA